MDKALFFEGNKLLTSGDTEGAERCFLAALALNPDFAEVLCNLGLLRERAGSLEEAEALYQRAIALRPEGVQFSMNLGVLLMKRRRFVESEFFQRQALQLAPNLAEAWSNLGVLLACTKRENEAEQCYRIALQLDPTHTKASFNLSYILLRQGRFEEGWRFFEVRHWHWYDRLSHHFTFPRWQGEDLHGKSVLIAFDAGHGDMIQFCRYASVLKTMGVKRITLVCHPTLKILFHTLSGVDEVFSLQEEVPNAGWDFWTPPLSLPYYCRTRLENIPADIPYLAADPRVVAKWSRWLGGRRLESLDMCVGLVWKGNPHFENDSERSLPSLDILAPLGTLSGVHFISLQKGMGENEAHDPPRELPLLATSLNDLNDFADTAALIACLDLVISVDTAVAHLAGALGKPCWVLLPDYLTDWRWLTERTDSLWYPGNMRLFRQPSGGGWSSVVSTLVDALRDWINHPTPTSGIL